MDKTLRDIILSQKNNEDFLPSETFVQNSRISLLNIIEHKKQLKEAGVVVDKKEGNIEKTHKPNIFVRYKPYFNFLILILVIISTIGTAFIVDKYRNTEDQPGKQIASTLGNVEIKPEKFDESGIETDSAFIITITNAATSTELKTALKIEPAAEFNLKQESEKQFRLEFEEKLAENQIYKFTIKTKDNSNSEERILSWAFQTKDTFRIIQSLPKNRSTSVPLDTGIEIELSHSDVSNNFLELIQITPETQGRIERVGKNIVFIPQNKLNSETIYTVTLKSGLKNNPTGEELKEDYIFQFETGYEGESNYNYASLEKLTYEFSNTEKPYISINSQSISEDLDVQVFRFSNIEDFKNSLENIHNSVNWGLFNRSNYSEDTSKLERVLSFSAPTTEANYRTYFEFPQTLENGFYIVETKLNNKTVQGLIQITDLSAFVSLSTEKSIAWVNDVNTGKPLSNAGIEILGLNKSFVTDEKGVSFFETPVELLAENEKNYTVKITSKEKVLLIILGRHRKENYISYSNSNYIKQNYWSYLYIDRDLYKPNDTLSYYGLFKARDPKDQKKDFTLKLENGNYDGKNLLYEKNITVNDEGLIQGEIKLENLSHGFYTLTVSEDDEVIQIAQFRVENFVKPTYQIEVSQSKEAIFIGETVEINGKVSFFDGTPVADFDLVYDGGGAKPTKIKTDSNGEFKFTITPELEDQSYFSLIETEYIDIKAAEIEYAETYSTIKFKVFKSDTALQTKNEVIDNLAKVTVSAKKVDINNAPNTYIYTASQVTGDPVTNKQINAKISRIDFTQIDDGEYYDFLNKKVVKRYRYNQKQELVKELEITTDENGEGLLEFEMENDKQYNIEIESIDSEGRTTKTTANVSSNNYLDPNIYGFRLSYESDGFQKFKVGDRKVIKFNNSKNIVQQTGENIKYLFVASQGGIKDFNITENPEINLEFKEEYVPNVILNGVYFNGKNYIEAEQVELDFDETENKLDVKVTTDKEKYKPRDTVNLTLEVKDKDGNPVESSVNINVIDEALYKVMYEQPTALNQIYTNVGSGIIDSYSSHRYIKRIPQYGATGGGPARNLFEDKVYFKLIKTDKDGVATASFELPDNLTTWRATIQSISNDKNPKVGDLAYQIPVSLPFFVDASISNEYLESDKPQIKIVSAGESVESQKVDYIINSETLDLKDFKLSSELYSESYIQLPNLKLGNHKISIKAKYGELEDEIIKEINVVESKLQTTVTDYAELSENTKPNGSKDSRTTLILSDKTNGQYYSELLKLNSTFGDRLDQKISRGKSNELIKTYFNQNHIAEEIDYSDYQTESGGISIFPYSDADLLLSAQIADMMPDKVNKTSLKNYFENILSDPNESKERFSIALYGLASFNSPILTEINYFVKINTDLSPLEKVYIGLAYAKLGDYENAHKNFGEIIKNSSEDFDQSLRIKYDENNDNIQKITALTLNLASILGRDESDNLYNYLQKNSTENLLTNIEKLIYLNNILPNRKNTVSKFTYELYGNIYEKVLENGAIFSLDVSSKELSEIKLKTLEGKVSVISKWNESISGGNNVDNSISVKKTYSKDVIKTNEFEATDVVQVTIDFTLPDNSFDGCYSITDYLPAGLTPILYVPLYYQSNLVKVYPYESYQDKISFCVSKKMETRQIVYYARPTAKGEFKSSGVTIQSLNNSGSFNFEGESTVVIK